MIGNPEDIIISMEDVDIRYRNKAIELLKKCSQIVRSSLINN